MPWMPIFVLPNIDVAAPIEAGPAALAPMSDARVSALARRHKRFESFLNRFTDSFGVEISPAVMLLRSDAPVEFRGIDAIASFRDLIAIVAVSYNRALEIKRPYGHRIHFANAFEFYPWMIDKYYKDLVGNTPAFLGLHEVRKFRGQSSAALPRMRLDATSIEEALVTELLGRWRRRYQSANPSWPDVALFRSLNMAHHASMLPAGTDTTIYDVGRLISLWVSAFEILIHPGGNGQANRDKVFDLLDRTPWQLKGCSDRQLETGGKTKIKRTLASWLYQHVYECRCAFLHGNPVDPSDLLLPVSRRNVFQYAAPLYRMALVSFLPLAFTRKAPPISKAKAFGAYVAARMSFREPQRAIEEALLTAIQPPSSGASTRVSSGRMGP
ncbi:MAG: hypothetical protein ABL996_18795 [Micropepsaceae bacterium]